MKRTEIRRYAPLQAKAKLSARTSLTRRKAQSAKRVNKTGPSKLVVALVFDRDGGCCIRCAKGVVRERRGEDWSLQHRRARGRGGDPRPETNLPANLVILCGSATSAGGCHEWAESNRTEARLSGLSMRWKQDPQTVPISTWWGPVYLDDKGRWRHASTEPGCVCEPVRCVTEPLHCEHHECPVCDDEGRWTEVPS